MDIVPVSVIILSTGAFERQVAVEDVVYGLSNRTERWLGPITQRHVCVFAQIAIGVYCSFRTLKNT